MEKNYIVTTVKENSRQPNGVKWKDLQTASYDFQVPFYLALADNQSFMADKILRLLPGRRLVAAGTWLGRPVVAKIFFDAKQARRQMEKDLAGVKLLEANKIPTASLFFQGMSEDKRIQILIFEKLSASSLETVWRQRKSDAEVFPVLESVIKELATQHVLGIVQQDLHLKNFLLTEKKIYTLDGGQIDYFLNRLEKKASIENLALFLSQLGVGNETVQEKLFKHYAKLRGWLVKSEDSQQLKIAIKKYNAERWQHFEKKIFRNCTDFVSIKNARNQIMLQRTHDKREFRAFLQDPESIFQHPTAVILKRGRSATVIRVQVDQNQLVIKRYNIKNAWHYLRRAFRDTRAKCAWRLAQKLQLFGVRTAAPVAYLENRYMGLRGRSYYVTEYVQGQDVSEYFSLYRAQEAKITEMIQRTIALLKNVAKLDMTHGDLKSTNMLIDQDEHPILIDWDGASEHSSSSSLRNAWRHELERFLKNFQDQPALREQFRAELNQFQ